MSATKKELDEAIEALKQEHGADWYGAAMIELVTARKKIQRLKDDIRNQTRQVEYAFSWNEDYEKRQLKKEVKELEGSKRRMRARLVRKWKKECARLEGERDEEHARRITLEIEG